MLLYSAAWRDDWCRNAWWVTLRSVTSNAVLSSQTDYYYQRLLNPERNTQLFPTYKHSSVDSLWRKIVTSLHKVLIFVTSQVAPWCRSVWSLSGAAVGQFCGSQTWGVKRPEPQRTGADPRSRFNSRGSPELLLVANDDPVLFECPRKTWRRSTEIYLAVTAVK